ncbi:uncharacterized protein EHS24_003352 [Apiotrichum porosum]|uniref:Uncharacterized protein n=1 Tax=Apiotrichum porosum TaxID=105984 RepID=A0A427XEQ4_9TREE|nr:uncharacterized protein EHS24_003352 [Apiotrichum porosum]RSH77391.1 hypothetical protein EHS24_003352 [Apiotrichum porosum]
MPAIRDTSSTRAAGNGATPTNRIYGSRPKQTARGSSNNGPPGWWNTESRDVGSDEELSGDDDDDQDSVAVEASYVEDILLLSHDKDGIHSDGQHAFCVLHDTFVVETDSTRPPFVFKNLNDDSLLDVEVTINDAWGGKDKGIKVMVLTGEEPTAKPEIKLGNHGPTRLFWNTTTGDNVTSATDLDEDLDTAMRNVARLSGLQLAEGMNPFRCKNFDGLRISVYTPLAETMGSADDGWVKVVIKTV